MANTSSKCANSFCGRNSVIPIYFRTKDRSFQVAFYLCKECNRFSDFIMTSGHSRLPLLSKYYDGVIVARLVKEKREEWEENSNRKQILQIKKSIEPCFECGERKYERLYVRIRPRYQFVGYVCKKCKVIYLINYKSFRLRVIDFGSYEESCVTRNPEIPKEEYLGTHVVYSSNMKKETEDISIIIKRKDIPRLKKILEKHKIEISSSSNELTPFFSWLHQ